MTNRYQQLLAVSGGKSGRPVFADDADGHPTAAFELNRALPVQKRSPMWTSPLVPKVAADERRLAASSSPRTCGSMVAARASKKPSSMR
jgi:hypothetical protein